VVLRGFDAGVRDELNDGFQGVRSSIVTMRAEGSKKERTRNTTMQRRQNIRRSCPLAILSSSFWLYPLLAIKKCHQ
jgi:hypothetical protein